MRWLQHAYRFLPATSFCWPSVLAKYSLHGPKLVSLLAVVQGYPSLCLLLSVVVVVVPLVNAAGGQLPSRQQDYILKPLLQQ